MWRVAISVMIVGMVAAGAASGPTNIDAGHRFGWGENIGWLNWRDAAGGEQGARVGATILSGFVWSENVGWINLGNGQPDGGEHYANVDGGDFGVNIDPPTGDLFGLAWGENIGWIRFDTRDALAPHGQQARFDYAAGRFRGYAWGENVGWISLDDAAHFVAEAPPDCNTPFADANGDEAVDQADFAALQRCITGPGGGVPPGCECFNRPQPGYPRGTNEIGAFEIGAFAACVRGPAVPADPACGD